MIYGNTKAEYFFFLLNDAFFYYYCCYYYCYDRCCYQLIIMLYLALLCISYMPLLGYMHGIRHFGKELANGIFSFLPRNEL